MAFKTPGVYVEEISTLPPSVAEVATAIPAFVGFTEKGSELARIDSFLEFETLFGGPTPSKFSVTTTVSGTGVEIASVQRDAEPLEFSMYYQLRLYFLNGGGSCYVVPAGNYDIAPTSAKDSLIAGIAKLRSEDEPTLIVVPDAVILDSSSDFADVNKAALQQCDDLKDRFTIMDVRSGDVEGFRDNIGIDFLKYGAAYTPYLQSSLSYTYDEADVSIAGAGEGEDGVAVAQSLASIKTAETALYNEIKAKISGIRVVVSPCAAMAGVYARVDRDRGVWKAPANVGVLGIVGPVTRINDAGQESLNVDPTAGKSINAIRSFAGRGTVVWGARTLAGNDNEWRYISVRRLFNLIEESTKKATAFAVFEANDATTWLKVKAMIESYLYGLWERGALAGPTPEAAYFVKVGLGHTMTTNDVLEGRMKVEIGVAAVRPAEFIILRFTHKLQEA